MRFYSVLFLAVGVSAFGLNGLNATKSKMDCGTAELCGVLCIESGLGGGVYKHNTPVPHGLWPQTPPFGTSQCISPTSKTGPTKVYSCYKAGASASQQLEFEQHEWSKHGVCASGSNVDGFFNNICDLSVNPIEIMAKESSLSAMASAMASAGYEVFQQDTANEQLLLSVCYSATKNAWIHSSVAQFDADCGGAAPPGPSPGPAPSGSCTPGQLGPACKYDSDCTQFTGCVRCARSGFCTDQQ